MALTRAKNTLLYRNTMMTAFVSVTCLISNFISRHSEFYIDRATDHQTCRLYSIHITTALNCRIKEHLNVNDMLYKNRRCRYIASPRYISDAILSRIIFDGSHTCNRCCKIIPLMQGNSLIIDV